MKYFLLAILMPFCVFAQNDTSSTSIEKQHRPWSFGIFYDQDHSLELLGIHLNEDRNYTMGFGMYYQSEALKKNILYVPLKMLNKTLGYHEKFKTGPSLRQAPTYALLFGGSGFTPDSLATSKVIYNDRPYASIMVLQTIINNTREEAKNGRTLYRNYRSGFTFGWLGASIQGKIQTAIHVAANKNDTRAPRTPRGWNNQVSNGGEPTLMYSYSKEMLLTKKHIQGQNPSKSVGLEFKHAYKYNLGYYTSLAYEFAFRAGKFDARNWIYNASPTGSINKNVTDKSAHNKKLCEIYLTGSARPVFMLYNALLNGQFRKSLHTVNFNDTRHLILEFEAGPGITAPVGKHHAVDFRLLFSGRSPEFKLPGRDTRFHYWAGAYLIYSFY